MGWIRNGSGIGGLVFVGTMAYVHADPPGSLECGPEPDPGPSQVEKTEMEMGMGSSHEKNSAERGGLATTSAARSDEASQLGDGTPDEIFLAQEKHSDGRTKVGKGLESIGDLTADALQRLASAVGSVAKAPAAIMASAGGLGSNANSPTSTCGTPLMERVGRLETQMAMLDEKYISKTLATELMMSPHSHPTTPRSMEKLRTARSLLQETEAKGTLVERVQALEDRLDEYMERYDKDLSSIQSKLAHINTGKLSLAIQDSGELSPSGDEFHDADQLSVNLEPLEQNFFEEADLGSDVHGEVRGISLTPQDALVEEPLAAASTAEPAAEDGADERGTLFPPLDPQLGSSPEEPRNALAKEPSPTSPSAQFSESAGEDVSEKSGIAAAAEENPSLTSVVDKPEETLVKEPATATSTVVPPELEHGVDGGKSLTALSFSDPQLASTLEEPQGVIATEPLIAEESAKVEEPAVKESTAADRSGSELAGAESPLTSTVEEPQGSLVKEPLLPEASAKLEEPSAHENADAADKTDGGADKTVSAGAQSVLTSAVKEPQTDTVGAATEDKHVQREYQYKAAEDVKALDERPGSFTSFIKEPKPSGRKEKKKKEKKEKRQDGFTEEKGRTNSLRAEGKRDDTVLEGKGIRTNSLRSEEKSKQPFKHLRDRFRRAFKSNKDP
ncbi:hypothetical protein KC19_2G197100 [Ceratodon purpureus]|uniref:Uncharacterized protein n=1 Tax=Ceratodon purpureus TaxID=3225 RepID=A0A8T0IXZ2_CERPU|nr:hypothetical protein KC19_2G197100 [Ceratodon purpureus]